MRKQEYLELLDKYEAGLASSEEVRLLHAYYNLFDLRKDGLQDLSEGQRSRLGSEIRGNIDQRILAGTAKEKQVKLWPRNLSRSGLGIAIAAAVAVITLGVWLYYASSLSTPSSRTEGRDLYTNDIAPGKNTAILTLADGKVIALDTNKTSVVVTDSVKTMTMLTASTPRGGTYQLTLPDGTNVWLNADSKISFPSQFNGKERKILMEGEAYFEVAKINLAGRRMPFIVETAGNDGRPGQQVEVLGTHFNVSAYKDESSTITTLLEGSVSVSSSSSLTSSSLRGGTTKQSQLLKPNQQAINTDSRIEVKEVDAVEYIAWKNNEFSFNGDDLQAVMRQIARWYDVAVVYEGDIASSGFVSTISRNKKLSEILRALEMNQGVHFKIEGRRIRVTQ